MLVTGPAVGAKDAAGFSATFTVNCPLMFAPFEDPPWMFARNVPGTAPLGVETTHVKPSAAGVSVSPAGFAVHTGTLPGAISPGLPGGCGWSMGFAVMVTCWPSPMVTVSMPFFSSTRILLNLVFHETQNAKPRAGCSRRLTHQPLWGFLCSLTLRPVWCAAF